MLISYKHKFIFVHCRKTAGSSVSVACNSYLGPDDVQVGAWQDAVVNGGAFNARAQGILKAECFSPSKSIMRDLLNGKRPHRICTYANEVISEHYKNVYGFGPSAAHPSARQVRHFDPHAWGEFFKFCVVRNPWTHAVSDYYWRKKVAHEYGGARVSFKEFLLRMADPSRCDPERIRSPIRSNWSLYTIDDRVVVDYVARFENLRDDLGKLQERIGIPLDLQRFRSKGRVRNTKKSVSDHYDKQSIELVRKIYAEEIDYFRYQPNF